MVVDTHASVGEDPHKVDGECERLAEQLEVALGPRFVAVYRFGSDFARGPRGARARLLVIVDAIDRDSLDRVGPIERVGRAQAIKVRIDTAASLIDGADAFPVLTLELTETRRLVRGDPVLQGLEVDPTRLRLRLEQNLRSIHRDLVQTYLEVGESLQALASALRRAARKLVYLLEGALIAAGIDVPQPATPETIVEAVGQHLTPKHDAATWNKLRAFAAYEDTIDRDDLADFYAELLAALAALVDIVDKLE